jgi:hypothetical protein
MTSGEPLRVQIRALSVEKIADVFGGLPSVADPHSEKPPISPQDAESRMHSLIEAAVMAPKFSFNGPDPDRVLWSELHVDAQQELLGCIIRLSGLGGLKDDLITFRSRDRRGRMDGGGTDGALSATDAASQAPGAGA